MLNAIERVFVFMLMGASMAMPGLAYAGPDLSPGLFYQYMPAKRSTLLAMVRNQGDATAFVTIELAEITFDAQGKAQEQRLAESSGFDRPLLATPPRLIVPAQGSLQVRLIYRGPRTAERYFRVRYVPVLPKPGDAFAIQPEEARAYSEALQAGVGVLKAIGTVLIVGPEQPRYATRLEPKERYLRVTNDGNATVRIDDAQYCNEATGHCTLSTPLHIRPGQHIDIERRSDERYRFELHEGTARTRHVYPQGQ